MVKKISQPFHDSFQTTLKLVLRICVSLLVLQLPTALFLHGDWRRSKQRSCFLCQIGLPPSSMMIAPLERGNASQKAAQTPLTAGRAVIPGLADWLGWGWQYYYIEKGKSARAGIVTLRDLGQREKGDARASLERITAIRSTRVQLFTPRDCCWPSEEHTHEQNLRPRYLKSG